MHWTTLGFLVSVTGLGCGSGRGNVNVTIWGEEFIADKIPPVMNDMTGFENNWTVRFPKFLLNVGNFSVASLVGTPGGVVRGVRVFDLKPGAMPLMIGSIPGLTAQRWDRVSFEMVPSDASSVAGNATPDEVSLMRTNGYSLYVEGEATHPMKGTYSFRWGFRNNVTWEHCQDAMNQTGLVVPTGGSVQAQITIHGDHLFYDDLQSPEAKVRFDPIAEADANMDHQVTLEELTGVDLTRLPTGQYGTGSVPDVRNLREFVTYLVYTLGHFNGEGECRPNRR